MNSIDTKFASLIQILLILLMILSVLDFFVTGFINQYTHSSLAYGLFLNYFLFNSQGIPKLLTPISLPIWGIFQFFMYGIVIILSLQLWKIYRTEYESKLKTLKFTTIFSFFIILLSVVGALMLSYTGDAAHGLYTMNITYVRIVIVFLYINALLSAIMIVKVFSAKKNFLYDSTSTKKKYNHPVKKL